MTLGLPDMDDESFLPQEVKTCVQILNQLERRLHRFLLETKSAFESPVSDSPLSRDNEWIAGHQEPQNRALSQIHFNGTTHMSAYLWALSQNLDGLRALLGHSPLLILPATTTVRSIYDAVAMAVWLIAPGESTVTRLVRSMSISLDTAQEGVVLTDRLTAPEATERELAAKNMSMTLEDLTNAKMVVKRNANNRILNVTFGGVTATLNPPVTQITEKYLSGVSPAWQLGSGAAHSRVWYINGVQELDSTALASLIFPVLDLSDYLVGSIGNYVGIPTGHVHQFVHAKREIVMAIAGKLLDPSWENYHQLRSIKMHEVPEALSEQEKRTTSSSFHKPSHSTPDPNDPNS